MQYVGCAPSPRGGFGGLVLFLLATIAVFAVIIVLRPIMSQAQTPEIVFAEVIVDEYSHSPLEHPEDQPVVRRCLGNKKAPKILVGTEKPTRWLLACWDEPSQHVVFQVIDAVQSVYKEKTAYIKTNMLRAEFRKFCQERGYDLIQGVWWK